MDWLILFIAGLLETAWVVTMKYSKGLSVFWPTVLTVIFLVGSMALLAVALKVIPMSTGYAVWTGIGVIGATIYGMMFFNEPVNLVRILCLCLILAGIIGLKMSTQD